VLATVCKNNQGCRGKNDSCEVIDKILMNS